MAWTDKIIGGVPGSLLGPFGTVIGVGIDFHPDKLASKGLPGEFMISANEQLANVNEAYDTFKKTRA